MKYKIGNIIVIKDIRKIAKKYKLHEGYIEHLSGKIAKIVGFQDEYSKKFPLIIEPKHYKCAFGMNPEWIRIATEKEKKISEQQEIEEQI